MVATKRVSARKKHEPAINRRRRTALDLDAERVVVMSAYNNILRVCKSIQINAHLHLHSLMRNKGLQNHKSTHKEKDNKKRHSVSPAHTHTHTNTTHEAS